MKKIVLSHPAGKGERTIDELTFQDPKVRHFLALKGKNLNDVESDIALVAALTGEAEILIGEIDLEDWVPIREYLTTVYSAFFGLKPQEEKAEAGETKSSDPTTATAKN